jgi:hypothetical protein
MVLPLPIPTTFAGRGKCASTAACAASRFALSMGESEEGSEKTSGLREGWGFEESLVLSVQLDQDVCVAIDCRDNLYVGLNGWNASSISS